MPGMLKAESSSVSASFACQSPSSASRNPPPHHQGDRPSSASALALDRWSQQLRSEERGLCLIHLLYSCANAVASNNLEYTNLFLEQLSVLASPRGDPMQRVASYFMEAMAARIVMQCWPGVYNALHCTHLQSSAHTEMLSSYAHQIFFNVCPFLKFSFLTVNQSILDAMEGERVVHVVDLEAAACGVVQWLALLQALRERAEGPPHLRITVVSERREMLRAMALRLSEEAERLDIAFQFHPVPVALEALEAEMVGVKTGEAVAVSSLMRLHPLLAHHHHPRHPKSSNASPTFTNSCSRLVEEEKSSQKSSWLTENSDKDQHQTKRRTSAFVDSVGDEKLEAGERHLISPPCSHGRKGESKRDRDRYKAETRRTVVSEIGNCTDHSAFGSPPSSGNHSTKSEHESDRDTIATSETAHQNGKNQFCLFERRGRRRELCWQHESCAIDRVLCMLRSLCPKLMVVVEQESNHNGSTLVERFAEALHYYSAIFDSMDSTLPQQLSAERSTLEKNLFGQQIHNIIACEGLARVERHEKLESWRKRMENVGFVPVQLSSTTMIQAQRLLETDSCEGYRLMEDAGCLTICWHGTPLFSSSAWQI